MMNCPYCGAEVLEGADACDECQHSLTDMSIPEPTTLVEQGLVNDRIDTLQPRTPLTVDPNTSVQEVLDKMVNESIGCVVVVDGDKLLGIFTERDALLKLNADVDRMADKPISTLMTPEPVTLDSRDKIAFALHKMNLGGYRHIPIITEGKLTGIISIRDILNYLTERISAPA